mmetsp:Transcript_37919/g.121971  ORF Transcript_37919/g.121971 Transcript_37919/m.121971 type:complete len:381 (-) Transcript_37919:728-1870(-)
MCCRNTAWRAGIASRIRVFLSSGDPTRPAEHAAAAALTTAAEQSLAAGGAERAGQAEVRPPAVARVVELPPRLLTSVDLVLGIDPLPDGGVQRRRMPLRKELLVVLEVAHGASLDDHALRHVQHVRGPALQVVEDVRAVEDRGASKLRLGPEEAENPLTSVDVQIGGDLIHQVHWAWLREDLQQLTTAPLTIRKVIDLPIELHLEHVAQMLAPLRVDHLLAQQFTQLEVHEEVGPPPVATIHDLRCESRVVEAVLAQDLREAAGNQALASQDGHHGRLACPVGANHENACAPAEAERHVFEDVRQALGICVGQSSDFQNSTIFFGSNGSTSVLGDIDKGVVLSEDPILDQSVQGHPRALGDEVVVLLKILHLAALGNLRL